MRISRPALHFLALGALLFALEGLLAPPVEPPPERVEVEAHRLAAAHRAFVATRGRPPDAAEAVALAERALDEELLFREALARGHHRSDPLVRRRLARNLRFLEAETGRAAAGEATLHEKALRLGLHASDPVVRRRLVQRIELALAGAVRARPPGEAELAAHHAATAERWQAPPRMRLEQVFLSRQARGPRLAGDAAALLGRLRAGERGEHRLGDPLPLPPAPSWSQADLARFLGAPFAAAVAALPEGVWSGPLASSQGLHLVRVTARREGHALPLSQVRDAVREDLLDRRSAAARRRLLATLRERHRLAASR